MITIPSIFISEREDELRYLFKELLESRGFGVIGEVSDNKEVIDRTCDIKEKPNLFIIDYTLPDSKGLETSEELLRRFPESKILFTGGDEKLIKSLKGKPNLGLLQKPFLLSTFLEAVHTMVFGPNNGGNNGKKINLFTCK